MPEIIIANEEYKQFLRCLNIIKESCDDVDIQEGIIRQRSNDHSGLIEIDLSEILQNATIPLIQLKNKLKLIEYFSGDVTIGLNDLDITFSDQYSSIKFSKPDQSYIDNKFITEDELSTIFILNVEDCILNQDIPKIVADRIRVTLNQFNVNRLNVLFEQEIASISAGTDSNEQTAKFLDNIIPNIPMNCHTDMIPLAFLVDNDNDINLKMYVVENNISAQKFELNVGDIDVNIYTRSILIENEPVPE